MYNPIPVYLYVYVTPYLYLYPGMDADAALFLGYMVACEIILLLQAFAGVPQNFRLALENNFESIPTPINQDI